jgi:hypothetical protein
MKNIVPLLACLLLAPCAFTQSNLTDTFNVKKLNAYALQEDVHTLLYVLDTVSNQRLTPYGHLVKERFLQRFVTHSEPANPAIDDPLVAAVLLVYHRYWSTLLLKQQSVAVADSGLRRELRKVIRSYARHAEEPDSIQSRAQPFRLLGNLLNEHGYLSYPDEKTGNLFDLFIWKQQDTVVYRVRLPETELEVPVYFMKGIMTLGWIEYASVGNSTPGGWPKNGALYCVARSYDTTSEHFKISFLQHEAQHFHDKQTYGALPSWRLEYRAKLAELATADTTEEKLLADFSMLAKADSTLPHPYGNYLVLHNLSALLFSPGQTASPDWKHVPREKLHEAALTLLRRDSRELRPSTRTH